MTQKILAASLGRKYTEKNLVVNNNFVITDSTTLDLGGIKDICAELKTESVPDFLICNVHPMFQRKVKQVWQEINNVFETNTIKDCFTTGVDFQD